MLDFFTDHGVELSIYATIGLLVFAIARTANASPLFAASLAVTPVFVAYVFFRHALPVLMPG